MRSLKQQASSKPPMRPYYLTEELRFLHPFLSIRPKEYKAKRLSNSEMEIEIAPVESHDISDDGTSLGSIESDNAENVTEVNRFPEINRATETSRITYNDNTIPNIMNGMNNSIENGRGRQNPRNSYSDDIECNPRKMFLLSMLPDIETLTESEMRIFRREVISTIDKIIGDRNISPGIKKDALQGY